MSLNKVSLIGRVGKDPEIRTTQDGREIANFSLATSERWKDKNTQERKEKTEWHRVVVFSEGLVSVIKSYVKKGSHIYLEGSLHTRKFQNKKGEDVYTTEVVLQGFGSTLVLLDSKKEGRPENNDYSSYDKEEPTQSKEGDYNPAINNPHRMEDFEKTLDDEVPF